MADYAMRPYRPGDEAGILRTFNAVFAQGDPSFQPMSLDHFRWAYLDNPAGTRCWVTVHGDDVAAMYSTQPNRVLLDGASHVFSQVIDSMVHPDHRRGLKRPGLFVELGQRFLSETCAPDRDLTIFGWPNENAWRIGRTYLLYECVRRQGVLSRFTEPGSFDVPAGVVELERFDDDVRDLYERCRGPWRASLIRDAAYLNWRFLAHPRFDYTLFAVRPGAGSGLAGYAVFRKSDWPSPDTGLVVDWLVPEDDPATAALLHDAILARARAESANATLAIFPEWSPWFARFQDQGWLVHPSGYFMSCGFYHPLLRPAWLRDHWWYTFAEMDLV